MSTQKMVELFESLNYKVVRSGTHHVIIEPVPGESLQTQCDTVLDVLKDALKDNALFSVVGNYVSNTRTMCIWISLFGEWRFR